MDNFYCIMKRDRIIFIWSGGKDSALALYEIMKAKRYDIVALLTTITRDYDRISMHGVRVELLKEQAQSIRIPLEEVYISKDAANEEYESKIVEVLKRYRAQGIEAVAFGDIFLEDIRHYREENLRKIGMRALFPNWKKDTRLLAQNFIDLGFKAIIVCVDLMKVSPDLSGMEFDAQFLAKLPHGVDPCGENGEFHTFVYDGPIFKRRVSFKKGERMLRDNRFHYCDLLEESGRC